MVLLIDHNDSFTYNLKQLAEECQSNFIEVLPYDKLTPDTVGRYRQIILSPGPETPEYYSYFKWFFPEVIKSKRVLGICLGHQAIGCFFGAKMINLDHVYHGISQQVIVKNPHDPVFRNLSERFDGGVYHSWALDPTDMPEELVVTAVSEDGIVMGIRHRRHDITGLQFHPESVMTPVGERIMRNWLTPEDQIT